MGGETSLYRVGSEAEPSRAIVQGRTPLYITRPEMPAGTDVDRIATVENREISYLAEARWASPAPKMVSELIGQRIELNVGQVYVPIQAGLLDHYVLSTRFTSYAAYYENGSDAPPVIRVAAQAELTRSGTSAPLAIAKFSSEALARENSVSSVIDAFDAASVQLVDEMAVWIGSNLEK